MRNEYDFSDAKKGLFHRSVATSVGLMPSILYLIALTVISHLFLLPISTALLNADFAIYPLTAKLISQGEWLAHQAGFQYGGNTLSFLRIPFEWMWLRFSQHPYAALHAQETYTHVVISCFITLSFYYLFLAVVFRYAALFAASVVAVGFHSLTLYAGVEFYNSYLIFGALLLGYRIRKGDLFSRMTNAQVFCISLLAGVALYSSSASQVFIVAAFVPYEALFQEAKLFFSSTDSSSEKWGKRVALTLFTLYVYLEVFSADLGFINGKKVKLYAHPNLYYAVVIVACLAFYKSRARLTQVLKANLKKILLIALGFFIGLAPEWIEVIRTKKLPSSMGSGTYPFIESMAALGKMPTAFQKVLSGSETLFRQATLILFLTAILFLVKKVITNLSFKETLLKNKREEGLFLITLSGFLAAFAFIRVYTYEVAPPRYFLPFLPFACTALAVLLNQIQSSRYLKFALVVCLIHAGDQITLRAGLLEDETLLERKREAFTVVEFFKSENVPLVFSNDYWEANQYSVIANLNPIFIATDPAYVDETQYKKAQAYTHGKIGMLFSKEIPDKLGATYSVLGKNIKISRVLKLKRLTLISGEI